jgi:hypothetical protein
MNFKLALTSAAVLATLAGTASASIITFSEAGSTSNSFTSADGTIRAEYVWSTGIADGHSHQGNSGGNLFEMGHGQSFQGLRFSLVGGGAITLDSFDMRGNWLVGVLNDGIGTLFSAGTAGSGAWTNQDFALTSTDYIYIYANGVVGPGDLDNISFGAAAIPEPISLALVGLGLAGVGLSRRRATKA